MLSKDAFISRQARGAFGRRIVTWGVLLLGGVGLLLTVWPRTQGTVGAAAQDTGAKYSRFSHNIQQHTALPCLLCHHREDGSAVPKRPAHTPCAGCHAQQFADKGSPICLICHSDPNSAAVKAFPRINSFGVQFDHARHRNAKCAICHAAAQRGAGFTVPVSFNAHAACYQCHSPRAQSGGRDISSCGTCHTPGRLVRPPVPSAAARVGFSHALHTSKVNCNECHTISAGAPRGRQVSLPAPQQHNRASRALSCGACHNDKRAFGGYNFTSCKRCHTDTFGFIRR